MKKNFGILIPTVLSATALTLAIACAPQGSKDSVNARRGKPCDPSTSRCDNKKAQEKVYGKLGADTLVEDLKKQLDAEKVVTQKKCES